MQIKSIILSTAALVSVVCAYPTSYNYGSESMYRRSGVLQCRNHNNQIMCSTTHECHAPGARPSYIPGRYAGNEALCTDGRRCKCV